MKPKPLPSIDPCPNGHHGTLYELMRCDDGGIFVKSGFHVSCGDSECKWIDDGPVRKTAYNAIVAWNKEVK